MRNLAIYILLLFIPILTIGQDDHFAYRNAIKLSLFEFGRNEFQFTYEHYSKDRKSSILLMPSFFLKENSSESIKGWQVMAQTRFYLTHLQKGMHNTLGMHNVGFYAGPYALYLNHAEDYTVDYWDPISNLYQQKAFEKTISSLEGGALIGVQFDITSRILMDFYLGGGIRFSDVEDTNDINEPYYNDHDYSVFELEYTGVKPRLGFQLGITF